MPKNEWHKAVEELKNHASPQMYHTFHARFGGIYPLKSLCAGLNGYY